LRFARLLTVAVLAGALAVATGCTPTPPPVSDKVQSAYENGKSLPPAPAKPVTVAAAGDSITAGNSPDFNKGQLGTFSWPSLLPAGEAFAGGWAKGGASTSVIAANVQPVSADVLVLIAGTNDLGKVPFSVSAANLQAIVQKVGIKRVIVSAIPPYDPNPELAVEYNQELEPFVRAQGWEFVDAMAGVRDGDHYAPGMTGDDGIHPTQPAVQLIAQAIAKQIKP
jgi:lysophospholipase L1-like esterase